ncbi:hypothetical protein LC989_14640, partial [Enterococcus faecium]|nr:hypothetical protein [Enterococcus faecium]
WKIFEKNLEFGTTGGRGSEFCFRTTTPPIVCRVPIFVPKSALSLLYQWIEPFFFDRHLTAVLTAVLKNRKKY